MLDRLQRWRRSRRVLRSVSGFELHHLDKPLPGNAVIKAAGDAVDRYSEAMELPAMYVGSAAMIALRIAGPIFKREERERLREAVYSELTQRTDLADHELIAALDRAEAALDLELIEAAPSEPREER